MKKRTSSLPVLVVVAVIALVLGSIGTAVAGPALTKKKVKAIATKVVKKQAPTLSVANAANAGNATLLNGQPASAYQTKATKYALPVATAVATRTYTFNGLAPGTYLASFAVEMDTSDTAPTSLCVLRGVPASPNADIFRYGDAPGNGFASLTGSAIVTVGAVAPTLVCSTFTGNFTISNATTGTSSASFVAIATTTAGTAVGAKPAGGASGTDAH